MAYIGNQPTIGQYRKLDDISGSFNGSLTAFTMQVGSTNVSAGSVFQLLISLGGVIQNPGTDFTVSGSTLTFTTAPTSGLDFFGILMGQPLNTATPGDGTITGAKLASGFNYDSGLLFLDDTNNRVGIGTTTVVAKTHVSNGSSSVTPNASADELFLENNGNVGLQFGCPNTGNARISFGDPEDAQSGLIFYDHSTNHLRFDTAATERARIDSSGRLLVGTVSALSVLTRSIDLAGTGTSTAQPAINIAHFAGAASTTSRPLLNFYRTRGTQATPTVNSSGDLLAQINFNAYDGNSTDSYAAGSIECFADAAHGVTDTPGRLVFSTTADGASSPTERMRVSQNGLVTIPSVYSNTTANAANVHVDSGGTLLRSTSSGKYKTNIETLEDFYADAILDCRPVWYRSTCESDNPKHGWWGFIAEEVAEIDPRLVFWKTVKVTYDENGSAVETCCDPEPEGVAYDRFVPHLLNLIKRQKEQIEAMEARLSALEA